MGTLSLPDARTSRLNSLFPDAIKSYSPVGGCRVSNRSCQLCRAGWQRTGNQSHATNAGVMEGRLKSRVRLRVRPMLLAFYPSDAASPLGCPLWVCWIRMVDETRGKRPRGRCRLCWSASYRAATNLGEVRTTCILYQGDGIGRAHV